VTLSSRPFPSRSPGAAGRGASRDPSRPATAHPPVDGPPGPEADPVGVARQICLQQLQARPRTRAELAAVLARRNVAADVAEEVLSRFADVGIIDDAAFSQLWVGSRHRGKGLAGRALRQELRRKGVDDQTITEAVEQLDPATELATARALVDRRVASTRGLAPDARVRRLAGMLARKGYAPGIAFRVVREALADEGQELDVPFDELTGLEDDLPGRATGGPADAGPRGELRGDRRPVRRR
jgi:regulatory protein